MPSFKAFGRNSCFTLPLGNLDGVTIVSINLLLSRGKMIEFGYVTSLLGAHPSMSWHGNCNCGQWRYKPIIESTEREGDSIYRAVVSVVLFTKIKPFSLGLRE